MAGKDAEGAGVRGESSRLKVLECKVEPPFSGVAQAAGCLQQSVGSGLVCGPRLLGRPVGLVNGGGASPCGILLGWWWRWGSGKAFAVPRARGLGLRGSLL